MISVIVPVYNVRPYLREAVDSLISQSYSDVEIILIDDGSTDGSGDICDAYQRKDDRIRVIHQKKGGLSAARNAGLDICKGELVSFLDPDDAFHRNMLLEMTDAMEKTGADIVECDFSVHKGVGMMNPEKGRLLKQIITQVGKNRIRTYDKITAMRMVIEGRIRSSVWCKIFNRKIWKNIRFPEGQNYEDMDIILKIIEQAERMCILDDLLVMHRIRSGSITQTHSIRNLKDLSQANRHFTEFIRENIPKYFSEDHIRIYKQRAYAEYLAEFFLFSLELKQQKPREYRDRYHVYLKRMISGARADLNMSKCSFRVRIADFMYRYMPAIIPGMIYHVYTPLRRLSFMMLHR